ncbi:UNVERIFIED_CONTAM: protein NRT1/ PTR FAMILY 8.1 [Sesamum radiatum]|uniref:Protein NRT1/ PTR FAMILY 8.1 n=1 Tax=Sesamum radiatum TaxID=300843 RepID=A0AAW2RFY4_SESRA
MRPRTSLGSRPTTPLDSDNNQGPTKYLAQKALPRGTSSTQVGAFLADVYLGRYWTIASFSVIYHLGMTLLTLSASVPGLRLTCYKKDECYVTNSQTAVFSLALYLVALGSSGMKPYVASYGADQFDDADEVEKGHKNSFFNWLYFSLNIGVLIGCSIPILIQENIGGDGDLVYR